jgi:NTP pyrophosphatase (non-canonical NTP hydrolase)
MKLAEFVKSSERTLAGGELKLAGQREVNLLHSAIGVSTEVGEIAEALQVSIFNKIDTVNLAEECADIMWYLAIPIRDFALDLGKLSSLAPSSTSLAQLVVDSSNFLDMMKKVAFYGKPIDRNLVDHHVCNIYQHMITMAHEYTFDLELAMSNNQDKLKARFPDKFSNENAINRDLNTERTELEKGM